MKLEWIERALRNRRCVGCQIELRGAAVIGLSIAWHPYWDRVTGGYPAIHLTIGCGWCDFVQGVDVGPSRGELLTLTEQLLARIRCPHMQKTAPYRDRAKLARDPRLKFEEPIGEEDTQAFLRMLDQTSFQCGSEDFQQWIQRLNRGDPPSP